MTLFVLLCIPLIPLSYQLTLAHQLTSLGLQLTSFTPLGITLTPLAASLTTLIPLHTPLTPLGPHLTSPLLLGIPLIALSPQLTSFIPLIPSRALLTPLGFRLTL